jgi:DNA-binding response OmpR family regulator
VPARKRSILIVDSDPFLAGLYARRFEAAHWNVRVAEHVDDARKAIARKRTDAVVVDTGTVEGGLALLQELRDAPSEHPRRLIALTAMGDRRAVADAYAAGAESYLLKGHFVPAEVVEKIGRMVSRV